MDTTNPTESHNPPQPANPSAIPIIDSHIHLYPSSEVSTLAWCTPSSPLWGQYSVDDYVLASSSPSLEGFIFLETDRKNDLALGVHDGSGWQFPLMEVDWLTRIATGAPRAGEGHSAEQKTLCLAIVPWAPLPSGPVALDRYVGLVKQRAGAAWGKVRGFRYLVQHQPRGTMVREQFVQGLRWLGREGFVFDVGIDSHGQGDWQLGECVEMMRRAHEEVDESDKVVFIINHLCKPDLTAASRTTGDVTETPKFIAWRTAMYELSRFSKTYMKLSGCFSEMADDLKTRPAEEIFGVIQPWLAVILATFGPFRTMFGSDWPVCTVGVPASDQGGAWNKWRSIVQRMCQLGGLSLEDQVMLWSGTAIKAYGLTELVSEHELPNDLGI